MSLAQHQALGIKRYTLGDKDQMNTIRLERFSSRFAEQVLNAKLALKQEIEGILTGETIEVATLSRPNFNKVLRDQFVAKGWTDQPHVFSDDEDPGAKMDFLKDRVGIEVGFGHASFIGIDLLKFQVSSYSGLDQIDVGVYITTTGRFQKHVAKEHKQKWEKAVLPLRRSSATYLTLRAPFRFRSVSSASMSSAERVAQQSVQGASPASRASALN